MPEILKPEHYDNFLPEDVQSCSRLTLLIRRAEAVVINKYRVRPRTDFTLSNDRLGHPIVQLTGYRTDDTGTFDPEKSNDDLTFALRDTVSRIVEHYAKSPNEYVESATEGDQSVQYREDAHKLKRSYFSPLRTFDERHVQL
jgi:hypothetical protein